MLTLTDLMTGAIKIFIMCAVILITTTACDVVTLKAMRDELRVIKTLHTVAHKTDSINKED